jgi:hypothetical protein
MLLLPYRERFAHVRKLKLVERVKASIVIGCEGNLLGRSAFGRRRPVCAMAGLPGASERKDNAGRRRRILIKNAKRLLSTGSKDWRSPFIFEKPLFLIVVECA